MSIRKKTILLVIITALALFGIVYEFTYKFLLNGFVSVEDDQVVKNVERLNDSIKANLNFLSTKSADWSRWDDPYQFMIDRNQDFIDSNLRLDSVRNLQINMMAYVATSGEVVISRVVDLNEVGENNELLPEDFLPFLATSSVLLNHTTLDGHVDGLVMLESGPMMVSSRPIVDSNGQGPVHGTIVFGRYIDQELIDQLSEVTHLKVEITPIDAATSSASIVSVGDQDFGINRLDKDRIAGFTYLKDINGQRILKGQIVFDRATYIQGLKSVRIFSIFYLGISVVFLVVIMFILERLILSRLTALGGKVDNVRVTHNLDQSVAMSGQDEFAKLSQNIDDMLVDLRVSQKLVGERDSRIAEELDQIEEKNETLENTQRAVLNVLEDLETEKKRIEETVQLRTKELVEEKAKLEASIRSLPVGFAMIGVRHELLIHNEILEQIIDCDHTKTSLDTIKDCLKDNLDLSAELIKIENGGPSITKTDLVLGSKFIKLFLAPVSHSTESGTAKVLGFLLLVEDITEAKMLERTREEFFAVASHELRTPLTAIRGNMSMIKDFMLPSLNNPDLAEMIDDSYIGAIRLINIVNDFLDASRLEQGKVSFKKEAIDVGPIVAEVVKELEAVVLSKKLILKMDEVSKDLPQIFVDRDRVKQIIFNLVGNAVNYTREGNVTIKASSDGKFVKVAVIDTGVGISLQNQKRLFKKFQQAQEEILTRDMTKSTGLGLYISKMLAEAMGGNIALDQSEVGKGSTFSVNFPIAGDKANKV